MPMSEYPQIPGIYRQSYDDRKTLGFKCSGIQSLQYILSEHPGMLPRTCSKRIDGSI